MSEAGRAVACPYCATGYFLPAELIGAAGARVRCPNCTRTFVVGAGEDPVSVAAPAAAIEQEATRAETAPKPAVSAQPRELAEAEVIASPGALANSLLDAMAERHGDELRRAASEGRLFAEYGRDIMESFDAWRRKAGRDADAAVFRDALRERWGVEFEPGVE